MTGEWWPRRCRPTPSNKVENEVDGRAWQKGPSLTWRTLAGVGGGGGKRGGELLILSPGNLNALNGNQLFLLPLYNWQAANNSTQQHQQQWQHQWQEYHSWRPIFFVCVCVFSLFLLFLAPPLVCYFYQAPLLMDSIDYISIWRFFIVSLYRWWKASKVPLSSVVDARQTDGHFETLPPIIDSILMDFLLMWKRGRWLRHVFVSLFNRIDT